MIVTKQPTTTEDPARMYRKNKRAQTQQNRIAHHASQTNSYDFFNLLTSTPLLDVVESQLPPHRERLYPPTLTLSMFLAQAMNSDASCQRVVNDNSIKRVLGGLSSCGVSSGGYCKARQRLPLSMVSTLAQKNRRDDRHTNTGPLAMARSFGQACRRYNTINARHRRKPSDLSAAT